MRTCVIGGAGFIGRYLLETLISSGRDVLVIGRRGDRPLNLNSRASYCSCDYGDRIKLRHYISDCDEIIDLAYGTVPKTSFENPIFDLQSNLPPTIALLEEAKSLQHLRRIVITSSGGTVYGRASRLPIIEQDETKPISPYGITKLAIERYAMMFHSLADLPVIIVRPSNAYGVGQRPFTGQGFIATAIGRILEREPVTIFGKNGTVRDYIHVTDIATGILCALEHGLPGETYNIGSGIGRSNRDVLKAIEPLATRDGLSIDLECLDSRSFDVPENVLSYGKLLSHTNWHPQVSFELGLYEMWKAMPKHLML